MFEFIKKFFHCIFVWHMPAGDTWGADVIIVHSSGLQKNGTPGPINDYLAELVCEIYARDQRLPIIAQGEVAKALTRKGLGSYLVGNIPTQRERKKMGLRYLDTSELWSLIKKICNAKGYKKPILLTPQPTMVRALLSGRKMGVNSVPYDVPRIVWDPECEQIWMTNPWLNLPREFGGRLLWLFQGKI